MFVVGETALHLACKKDFAELVRSLLKRGANSNLLTNEFRQSPLHYAVKSNAGNCITAFIEYNDDIEATGNEIVGYN